MGDSPPFQQSAVPKQSRFRAYNVSSIRMHDIQKTQLATSLPHRKQTTDITIP
jgi:hypothetical protein